MMHILRGMRSCLLIFLSLLLTKIVCASEASITHNCHLGEIRAQVKCGQLTVPENYQKPDGTQISINFAVLPAIDNSEYKTPLLFLAGGPGQAAVELATSLNYVFRDVRKTRDIILIDQRGTGESTALSCEFDAVDSVYKTLSKDLDPQEVKDCITQFSGDVTQFNSENAIRDFDAIRAILGHEKINLYGGSYGTRAGLLYMKMFPDSIDSVVLDSVGPIEVPIGLYGKSGERSFELLLENCRNNVSCHKAFPDLLVEFQTVKKRLAENPITLNIQHPRVGTPTTFVIDEQKFTGNLRFQLYSVASQSLVPLVINQAFNGNYLPIQGLISRNEGERLVYTGLLFNIVCNEDISRVSEKALNADASNLFDGASSQFAWQVVCPLFPQYRPSVDFYQPVTADIPTLIFSGNLDPVTPPSNGEYPAKTLPNSHHIVVKNAAHTVAMSTCANKIINEFLTIKEPKGLDESCLEDVPKPSFMTSVNGME